MSYLYKYTIFFMFSKKEIRKEKKLYAMNILVFWFEVKIFDNKFLITILKY